MCHCSACSTVITVHLVGICYAVLLERMRWDARRIYQLHSIGEHPPPVQDCIAFDTNDDECHTAFFCCPCAFLQLAAEWRVRFGTHCAHCCMWNTMHVADRSSQVTVGTLQHVWGVLHITIYLQVCVARCTCQRQEDPYCNRVTLLIHGALAGCSFNAHSRTLLLPWGPPLMCRRHNRRWMHDWLDKQQQQLRR